MPRSARVPTRHREEGPVDNDTLLRRYAGERREEDRAALLDRYSSFATALAARFTRGRHDDEDTRQVALFALLKAIDRFDPEAGAAFTTFAWATVLGELKRYRRDHSWAVRVPRRLQERYLEVQAAADELSTELGRNPTIEEIGAFLSMSAEEVVSAMAAREVREWAPLEPWPNDDTDAPVDALLGEEVDGYDRAEDRALLDDLFRPLTKREREMLRMRFVDDRTQADIGEAFGLSQMHVSRLLRQALERVREHAEAPTSVAG